MLVCEYMNEPMPQSSFFEEGIKLISSCPICQSKQDKMEVNILDRNEMSRLLHLRCQNCRAAVLALLVISPAGLNSIGMITDLSAGEVLRFKECEAIEADEVLSFHIFIQENKFWLNELTTTLLNEKA